MTKLMPAGSFMTIYQKEVLKVTTNPSLQMNIK
jgi:hypothetical protein